jgi:hypothetical protein
MDAMFNAGAEEEWRGGFEIGMKCEMASRRVCIGLIMLAHY